ncbi:MAG: hypothetical protein ACHQT8_05855 [Chlamydiales bacterium]
MQKLKNASRFFGLFLLFIAFVEDEEKIAVSGEGLIYILQVTFFKGVDQIIVFFSQVVAE